jgi:NAD(P)-dependent dehydrogenase (short-subunit alcohol dehydrogenase family)
MGLVAGKVAVVTGAGSGIGRASAITFAQEGAGGVVVVDRDEEGAEGTVEQIEGASGCRALAVIADVCEEAQVRRMVEDALAVFGRIDCAHNNAGYSGPLKPLGELELAEWMEAITVNLTSVYLCLRYEMAAMKASGGGTIVNTASVLGFVGLGGNAGYCAAKHGVLGLTKVAALEGAVDLIRVNAVCPARIDTPAVRRGFYRSPELWEKRKAEMPMGKMGEPQDVADAVVWLCSDRSGFMTGESMVLDGGVYVTKSR